MVGKDIIEMYYIQQRKNGQKTILQKCIFSRNDGTAAVLW